MKVEEIDLDNPRRSRVPEYFVAYLVGETKPTRDGNTNTMRRRVLNPSGNSSKKKEESGQICSQDTEEKNSELAVKQQKFKLCQMMVSLKTEA